jgi:hypothetical protein
MKILFSLMSYLTDIAKDDNLLIFNKKGTHKVPKENLYLGTFIVYEIAWYLLIKNPLMRGKEARIQMVLDNMD